MAIKINIGKILSTTVWSCVGAGVLVLLVAAIRYRNNNTCRGYLINITGPSAKSGPPSAPSDHGRPHGQPLYHDIALLAPAGAIENPGPTYPILRPAPPGNDPGKEYLDQKARLFFDNNSVSCMSTWSNVPLPPGSLPTTATASISTATGYNCRSSPNSPPGCRYSPATHRPAGHQRPDSLLKAGILRVSVLYPQDSFWMAQIAQVNITPDTDLRTGTRNRRPPHRLWRRQRRRSKIPPALSLLSAGAQPDGIRKYARIDVSYAGQVVATRKGSGREPL
jgi:hypothetical protein